MINWLVPPGQPVASPMERLMAGVVQDGGPPPAWVVADDLDDRWLAALAACPPRSRRHGVVAVRDPRSAAAAIRFGVGGAVWLPASASTLRSACDAAAAAPDPPDRADPEAAAALVEGARRSPTVAARLESAELWRRQWGSVRLLRWMHGVRRLLEVPAAVLPGPGLVVTGRSIADVRRAADEAANLVGPPPCPTLEVRTWRRGSAAEAVAWAAATGEREPQPGGGYAPVHELPSGEVVGRWGVRLDDDGPAGGGPGWTAVPASERPDGHRWHLYAAAGARSVVDDAVEPEAFDSATCAVRVPGWVTADLRPGSPAGILVDRMARRARRSGVVLWVPGVTEAGLRVILRTGARLWVDGPAVPDGAD